VGTFASAVASFQQTVATPAPAARVAPGAQQVGAATGGEAGQEAAKAADTNLAASQGMLTAAQTTLAAANSQQASSTAYAQAALSWVSAIPGLASAVGDWVKNTASAVVQWLFGATTSQGAAAENVSAGVAMAAAATLMVTASETMLTAALVNAAGGSLVGLQTGGITTRSTRAQLHPGEAVIPLNRDTFERLGLTSQGGVQIVQHNYFGDTAGGQRGSRTRQAGDARDDRRRNEGIARDMTRLMDEYVAREQRPGGKLEGTGRRGR
jgi:hypothetical protein